MVVLALYCTVSMIQQFYWLKIMIFAHPHVFTTPTPVECYPFRISEGVLVHRKP